MRYNTRGWGQRLLLGLLMSCMILPQVWGQSPKPEGQKQLDLSRAIEVYRSVLTGAAGYYVDTFDIEKVSTRGIQSMLSQLDPYTEYIPEMAKDDFAFMTTGEYGGIGAYIQQVDSIVYVQMPMPGSPAEKAGLKMGDAFLEIDGESVVPGTPSKVSGKLKGAVGTDVRAKVLKLGEDTPTEVVITRGNVVVDQVLYSGMYQDSIGYVRLSSFTDKSAEDVRRAYKKLEETGRMKSFILDLRSNGGGVMNGAIDILSMFVPKNTKVLYTEGRLPQTSQTYLTTEEPLDTEMPMVVMINGSSASASEIVAGALQDLDRAVLVGTKSFGKGLVQSTLPVPYDGILKVTISRYYIPSGRCIQQLDYSHRNPDGSVASVPDSLTQIFYTASGRPVRDGGGIRPDIEVKDETLGASVIPMMAEGRIFQFSNQLFLERPNADQLSDVVVTDEDFDRFVAFLEEKDFTYGEMSLSALEQLRELAEFEGYTERSEEAFKQLEEALTPDLMRDVAPHKEQVKMLLKGFLAAHHFGNPGQYAVNLETDPTMAAALEVLSDPARYREILQP
ncbi:MAG: S41 family peptidase [Porphyromonas sp.]|nr:S41 family peptidase [Porphyromonas sp.]